MSDEKKARDVQFKFDSSSQQVKQQSSLLDGMFAGIGEMKKILNVVIKADVQGSLELLSDPSKLGTDEVEVNVVASGVGGISRQMRIWPTSRAMVIALTLAPIIGQRYSENSLQLRTIIYDVIDDTKSIMGGMLEPKIRRLWHCRGARCV